MRLNYLTAELPCTPFLQSDANPTKRVRVAPRAFTKIAGFRDALFRVLALCLCLSTCAATDAAAAEPTLPEFAQVAQAVSDYFQSLPDYQPSDLMSQQHVAGALGAIAEIGWDVPITVSKSWFALNQMTRMLCMAILAIPIPYTMDPNIYGTAFKRMGASDNVSFTMDLAFRFLPTFARDLTITMDAQRARGYELDNLKGGLVARIRRLAPLIIPVVMQSTVTGEEVIDAMDLRAFGTARRTWLKDLKYAPRDYIILGLGVVIFIVCCVLKWGYGIGGFFVPDFFTEFLIK